MRPRSPEILVLTPRGGVYNHRYAIAENSPLDASGCGRIYRKAKELVGENAFGCGHIDIADGGSLAAARHVVAQKEAAGRRGPEWLIVVDPRIGGLDDAGRKRLQHELEERLSRLSPEVLDRISWHDHAESEVIPDSTLERWRQDLTPLLAAVRLTEPPPQETEPSHQTGVANKLRIAAMVATIFVALFLLAQVSNSLPSPFGGTQGRSGGGVPAPVANAILDKAATVLDIEQPTESRVIGRLAGLFSAANAIKAAPVISLKDLINDVRRSAMGDDQMDNNLLQDERFWESLKKACPQPSAPPDLLAFLSLEDAAVVGDIPDPKYVRSLAQVVLSLRKLDTAAAKPSDPDLVPLFASILNESDSITRHSMDESLKIFTRADTAVAKRLLRIFQNEDLKRVILEVRDRQGGQESLGAWMRTLGSRGRKGNDGLFSDAYFRVLLNIAEEKGSKPKQDCIKLLQKFCATCTELVRSSPARQVASAAPPGAGQPRTMPSGQ